MKFKTMFYSAAGVYFSSKLIAYLTIPKEVKYSIEQRCRDLGLKCERHFITTEDDYILQAFRIYDDNGKLEDKTSVIIQHGFQDSAINLLCNGNKSCTAMLAKEGYDMWLNNNRGNSYSRYHKYLDPDHDPEYWNFTFIEMGLYDTKALINYVKDKTKQEKIPYIGSSQGSTQMLYALTKDEDWFKERVNLFVALCPAIQLGPEACKSSRWFADKKYYIEKFLRKTGALEIPKNSEWLQSFYCSMLKIIPQYGSFYQQYSTEIKVGFNDPKSFQVFWYTLPNGASIESLLYWGTIFNYGKFVERDYGEEENLKRYGQKEPPEVDLTKIQHVPIALLVSKYDGFLGVEESRKLKDTINPVFYKEYEGGHISFLIGKDMVETYTKDVIKLLKEYSN